MISWIKNLIKGNGNLQNLVTLSELSEQTGIKYMTLYMAIRTGRLDAVQSGHTWLSSVDAVNRAIEEGRLKGGER
jgi:excisionase family DNA binding protein